MNDRSSGIPFDEIVVSLLPSFTDDEERPAPRSRAPETPRAYDALIYAQLDGPWQQGPITPPPGQADMIRSLPLAGRERLQLRWDRFRSYQAEHPQGERLASALQDLLIADITPGLAALLAGDISTKRPLRLWWFTRVPELGELPWELIASASPAAREGRISFVRGRPRGRTPYVPFRNQLRLAVVHAPQTAPQSLLGILSDLPPLIEVTLMPEPTRSSMARAVGEHCELVHLVATGKVSLGFDGILEPGGVVEEPLPASDLSRIVSGSRVSVIGLTPATGWIESGSGADSSPRHADRNADTAMTYRAFAYLGLSQEPLPTIVAPLAPLGPEDLSRFWRVFYEQLAETLSVEAAFGRAQAAGEPLPMALFLRNRLGRQFVREALEAASDIPDPTQVSADLRVSRDLVEQVLAINAAYGELADQGSFTPLIDEEIARQGQLQDTLSTWSRLPEEEG